MGTAVGCGKVGKNVGVSDRGEGLALGRQVGKGDGWGVGSSVGLTVGSFEGRGLGGAEGPFVGL